MTTAPLHSAAPDPPLLPRVSLGDPGAVEACIARYGGLVAALARRHAVPGEVEDLVQEIFLDLWRNAGRFDATRGNETTFVATIARRRLIDRLRRLQRRPLTDPFPETGEEPSGDDHHRVEWGAEVAIARRALAQLAPERRRLVVLSLGHGLSHAEIAALTRLPLGTVKTWVRRGLLAVRESLKSRPVEGVQG